MQGYFYGWYFKCQSDTQTLAVIPAVHETEKRRTCSIQIITNEQAWTIPFAADDFRHGDDKLLIDKNQFGKSGIRLAIHTPELTAKGRLYFGALAPLQYDIMGPFALVPFLECRHSVRSMRHLVNGTVNINGQEYSFHNAWGYWEGDRGRSFPKEYAWTQCIFPEGSLMLSVADIPMAGFHFTGVIGTVLLRGREYRFATYLGAKAVKIKNGMLRIIQGDMVFEARLLQKADNPLKAPKLGDMVRTVHESASCRACYRFRKGNRTLFSLATDRASFEYEYQT